MGVAIVYVLLDLRFVALSEPGARASVQAILSMIPSTIAGIGHDAAGDAGWILPALLTLLVAIYIADFGQRNVEDRHISYASRPLPRVFRLLPLMGTVLAAFSANYIALAIATVVIEGKGGGHLIGIVGVGIWIVVFGTVVGAFYIVRVELLIKQNHDAQAVEEVSISRLGHFRPIAKLGAALTTVTVWILIPIVAAVVAAFVHLPGSSWLGIFVIVSWVQVLVAGGAVPFRAFLTKSRAWQQVFIAVLMWLFALAGFAVPVIIFIFGNDASKPYAGVALAASVAVSIAWLLPARNSGFLGSAWLPSIATLSILKIFAERRFENLQLEEAELTKEFDALLAAAAQTTPLARSDVEPLRRKRFRLPGFRNSEKD